MDNKNRCVPSQTIFNVDKLKIITDTTIKILMHPHLCLHEMPSFRTTGFT